MSSTTPQLRPLGIGDILDRAVRIYRDNFVKLITIVVIVSIPVLLLQVCAVFFIFPLNSGTLLSDPTQFSEPNVAAIVGGLGAQWFAIILSAIGAIFQTAALAAFVSERYLGRVITVGQAYRMSLSRWLALILASILIGLVVTVILGVLLVPFIAVVGAAGLGAASDEAAGMFGAATLLLCCLFLPVIAVVAFFSIRWLFYIQAIVIEEYNSTGGLGRSWHLVKGSFWRTLGFALILAIISLVIVAGPSYFLAIITTFIGLALPFGLTLAAIANIVVPGLLQILVLPFTYAALTLYYYDLRVRKEGLDLQLQLKGNDPSGLNDLPSLVPPREDYTMPIISDETKPNDESTNN